MQREPSENGYSTPRKGRTSFEFGSASAVTKDSSEKKLQREEETGCDPPLLSQLTDTDKSTHSRHISDRFIPLRKQSKLNVVFSKLDDDIHTEESIARRTAEDLSQDHGLNILKNYLKSEILGIRDDPFSSHYQYSNKNLFSFSYPSTPANTQIVSDKYVPGTLSFLLSQKFLQVHSQGPVQSSRRTCSSG